MRSKPANKLPKSFANKLPKSFANKLPKLFLTTLFIILFAMIPIKLLSIHFSAHQVMVPAQERYRYSIYDCRGNILAATIPTVSLYVDPSVLPKSFDSLLSKYFPGIIEKLSRQRRFKSKFLWLERHTSQDKATMIKNLYIPGVRSIADYKRVYPFPELTGIFIGFCDANHDGKHGVELAFNEELREKNINLSIDLRMQGILHEIMSKATEDFEADGASGVILDARSGQVMAMVSVPSPIDPMDFLKHTNRNRNLDPVEVGSVLKLLNIAIAIESGQYNEDMIVDARGPLRIGKFEINDLFGVNREITVKESLWRSSNIANARIALGFGRDLQKEFFGKLGLLSRIQWMPRHFASVIRPRHWKKTTTATLAYGYGIGMTTLHLAKVVIAVVNGKDLELSILREPRVSHRPIRVFSRDTVKVMRGLMQSVVTNSYKKTLNIHDEQGQYNIGAKTGTANLIINGKYMQGQNFVTLAAVVPGNAPDLLVIIQMTNPKRSRLTQGTVTTAGNVLSKYMREILQRLIKVRMIIPKTNLIAQTTLDKQLKYSLKI